MFFKNFFQKIEFNGKSQTEEEKDFIFSNNGHRLIKKIIQSLPSATENNRIILEESLEVILRNIEVNMDFYLNSKGVFIIISLLEHSVYAEKLKEMLMKYRSKIESNSDNSGSKMLKELLFSN